MRDASLIRLAAVSIAFACMNCSSQPDPATLYVPDTAGLVRRSEVVEQNYRVTLDDGRILMVPVNSNFIQGKSPRGDAVVLTGIQPVPWVYWADLRPEDSNLVPPGCYVILGRATMSASHVFQTVYDVRGDVVMAFPKTADWTDEGYIEGSQELAGVGTCINPLGQAFHRTY
jgi:hypothetical protein